MAIPPPKPPKVPKAARRQIDAREAQKFVYETVHRIVSQHGSKEEVLVVLETVTLSMLLLLFKYYKLNPQHATDHVEAALNKAVEQFAKRMNT